MIAIYRILGAANIYLVLSILLERDSYTIKLYFLIFLLFQTIRTPIRWTLEEEEKVMQEEEEETENVVEMTDKEADEICEHNFQNFKDMLAKLENIIESGATFYEAQKVYYVINKNLNNPSILLYEEQCQELEKELRVLERKMMKLSLKR